MSGTLVGTFRSWRDPWGFIVCPGAFEGDLFAHREHFVGAAPPGDLTGASVQFVRGTDPKGRPNAQQIVVLGGKGRGGPTLTPQPAWRPSAPAPPVRRAVPALPLMPALPVMQEFVASNISRTPADKLAHYVGAKLRGEIRSWKGDWGFIVCPAKFDGDLFVHRQNLRISSDPAAGKQVSFTVSIDQRGRAAAAEVTEPTPAPEDFAGQGMLSGQIRSWKKDWGFIVAPDLFEGDLFCHQESLLDGNLGDQLEQALVGRTVNFEVAIDKRKRPCAAKVQVSGMPEARAYQPPQALDSPSELLQGTLRSWRDPWGFIVCPEHFQGDLFCHKEAFVGPPPTHDLTGYRVQFRRNVDPRGRPHAIQVTVLGPGPDAAIGGHGKGGNGLVAPPPVAPFAGHDAAPPVVAVEHKFDHVVGLQLHGQVRSWKNDWGFAVAPESFEGDLFVHKGHLEGGAEHLAPGARIAFEVGIDTRGRATALHVRCLSEAKDWAGTGVRLTGAIRSWKEPWGFIVAPGSFQGDLFFHIEHMGHMLRPEMIVGGMEVSFKVEKDKQGRFTAAEIMPAAPLIRDQAKRGPMTGQQPFDAKRMRV